MIEIEYIAMKTPDGQTAGHARIQGGFVDIRLRKSSNGQALILTDNGYVSGGMDMRIRAGGHVTAVAVHTGGHLDCVGFARAGMLTLPDIRRRIDAIAAKPASPAEKPATSAPAAPAPATPAPAEPPLSQQETLSTPPVENVQPEDSAETEVIPMRRSARHTPAVSDVKLALDRLAQPADAAFFPSEQAETHNAPRVLPALLNDADDEHAAAFAALLARADAVFHRINDPFSDDDTPPLPFPAPAGSASCESAQAPAAAGNAPASASRDLDAWSRAVDDILSETSAPTGRSIDNPFPHIFPDARFVHRGGLYGNETLMGDWARGGESFRITAVRGEYSPQPPETLPGFTRYIRTLQGGFWVRVEDGNFSCAKEK